MRIATCQMNSRENRNENVEEALRLLDRASELGADVATLPEYTEYLGPGESVVSHSEVIPGPLSERFAAKAKEKKMWVLVGSIRENIGNDSLCANTSLLFDRNGTLVAKYRKLHLYDVDLPGRVTYRESDTVAAGLEIVTADLEGLTVGLSICYDLRFPELFRLLTLSGAKLLFVPAAFNLYTGRDHWEVLLRARAIENQCFVVAPGQIGRHLPAGACNGRSMIIDPWGTVLSCAPDTTGVSFADIDISRLDAIRSELPSLKNRRPDAYSLAPTSPQA